MQFLFIIFGFYLLRINSKALTCEIVQMQQKIKCQNKIQDCFILEGDEEDYYKLKHIDKEIIKKSFTIPYKSMPIQIKMFKSLEYGMIQRKLICSLSLNYQYYITCIAFDKLNYSENTQFIESIKIETNILSEESCDEMQQLDDGGIILFCLKQSNLKQYLVSLQGDVILLFEYDVADQIQDKCNKKQYNNKGKNQFIIAFFKCSQWKIFQIYNQQIKIISESRMKENFSSLQYFSKVEDVQQCSLRFQTLYLLEGNNYLEVWYDENHRATYQLYKSQNVILKIILFRMCSSTLLITYSKENKFDPFEKIDNEIVLYHNFETDNIHFFWDFLFLQNQTQLIMRIDKHLIQTYEILNTSLNFFEKDSLICQIDKQNNLVQFYKYFPLNGFIEPKQKFIYSIKKLEVIDTQSLIKCFRIQYNNKQNEKREEFQFILIKKNCQVKQEINLAIESFLSFQQQEFSIYNDKTGIMNLSIQQETKDDIKCYYQLKKYKFKSQTQLRSTKQLNYLIFQVDDQIYFHNCKENKIQMIINTKQFEVFQNREDYYLIDKKKQQLKVIKFQLGIIKQIDLHNNIEIIKAEQVQEQLILHLKNEKSPTLVSQTSDQYFNYKYLSQNLIQQEEILYYLELGIYKFIQYSKIFASEVQGEVNCFEFSGFQILLIQNWLKGLFQICTVQNQTNSILLHYFDSFEILYKNIRFQILQSTHVTLKYWLFQLNKIQLCLQLYLLIQIHQLI